MKTLTFWLALIVMSCTLAFGQTYKVLYSFAGPESGDGSRPLGSLVMDHSGNLYGTTFLGGASACGQCGIVFELSPSSGGEWTETVIHNFCSTIVNGQCIDGSTPRAGLVLDSAGNLYGTTDQGGSAPCTIASGSCGVVYELSPPSQSGGPWTETVLYNFCSNETNGQCLDGFQPRSQLVFDASGNLYGTTSAGGSGHFEGGSESGTVFELSKNGDQWTETVLYNFCSLGQGNFCPDGSSPQAGVTFDQLGNLYGTTELGGAPGSEGGGTVYKLTPNNGSWTQSVLFASRPPFNQGENPMGTVSIDPSGNLYSTLSGLGPKGDGSLFRILPKGGASVYAFDGLNGGTPASGVLVDAKHSAIFGTTAGAGAHPYGTVFEMVAPAQETVLYFFCSQTNCTDGAKPLASPIQDKSGNLYGTTSVGGINNNGVVFEITP